MILSGGGQIAICHVGFLAIAVFSDSMESVILVSG